VIPRLFSRSNLLCNQLNFGLSVLGSRLIGIGVLVVGCLFSSVTAAAQASPGPSKVGKWRLTWSDEFSGPNGSGVDASKWVVEVGGKGWGNQELEYYTSRRENAHIFDGSLVIEARREEYAGADGVKRNYTSARIKTAGKFSQNYGRFEARIKIPSGQGMWPAFWMLGDDIDKAGWPACGEIDIMENIGKEPSTIHGSIHGPGYTGGDGIEAPYKLPATRRFADDFHVFAVEWEPNAIRFYVDDDLYVTRSRSDLRPGWKWVFDHPFFLILNLAVGGDWPGNPDAATVIPQTMLVDYVRVYQRSSE
jgi:beta-glucanase (GH16 family)